MKHNNSFRENSMIDAPMVVHPNVLQQFAAAHRMPFATVHDKIKAQTQYINYCSKHN